MNPYQGTARSNATAHPFANSRQLNRALRRAHKPRTAPAPTKNRAGILVPAAMPKSAEARSHQGSGELGVGSGEWGNRVSGAVGGESGMGWLFSLPHSPLPTPHSPLSCLSQKTRSA